MERIFDMKRVGNAGTILMYNLSGPEFSKLRQIFAMLRLRMRVVEPDRYHIALSDLAASFRCFIKVSAALRPPLTPKDTTPQVPLGMYFLATS